MPSRPGIGGGGGERANEQERETKLTDRAISGLETVHLESKKKRVLELKKRLEAIDGETEVSQSG